MPKEFWREVVDRVAAEVPDTLLLAEAFWLLEGYFVRTLGMHRVYNSAFMHMLRDENNAGYRKVMKETLEFDPAILQRYVNFMSNPDEATAIEQFGKDDKYLGVATLLATLPGLPLLGHGQVEGFGEKYGMEFRRAQLDEQPDRALVERHEREIFPLLHRRGQFAGAEDFLLYDFATDGGAIDENVFAYSNGRGPERTLVVYHNRFGSTAGWIRDSVAFAVRSPDGSKRLERRNLAHGLAVPAGADDVVAFRDARSGLEYLRGASELRDRGLWLQLDAYSRHVFWEFRDIHDPAGIWRGLAGHLGGRGVPSLEDALRELELEPVYAAVRRLAALAGFRDLVRLAAPDATGSLDASLGDVARAVRAATGTEGDPDAVAAVAARRLARIAELAGEPAEERDGRAETDGHGTATAPGDPLRTVRGAFGDTWHRAVLAAWAVLEPLGRLAPAAMAGPTSRAWFDELRLDSVLAAALRDAGLDDSAAWAATERVRLLLALPRPSNIGGRSPADRSRRLVDAWLAHPDVRAFLRINRWEDVDWYGRGEWRELLDWALLLDAVDAADPTAIDATAEVIRSLADIGEQSGYRVDRLTKLVRPATSDLGAANLPGRGRTAASTPGGSKARPSGSG
jgi:hypothetical protein